MNRPSLPGAPAATLPAHGFVRSGVIAGLLATVGFTVVHDLVISDIWATLPIMAVAGAACGASLAWSYAILFPAASLRSWLAYTTSYLVLFGLLGVLSIVLFEPVTTMAEVTARGGPIDDLIGQALPVTIAFTLVSAVGVTLLFGRGWRALGPVLVTTSVLVVFLGLNISAIGLVDIPVEGYVLVAELFGLVAALGVSYAVAFAVLERRRLPVGPPVRSVTPLSGRG